MKNSRSALAFLFGFLIGGNILGTESIYDENSNKIPTRTSSQQDLIRELGNERKLEDKLSKRSTALLVEYREVLLFGDKRQIVQMMALPEHPYKINMDQLFQCRQRIGGLKEQLLEIGYLEEYVFIQFSFPKPNPNRFGFAPIFIQYPRIQPQVCFDER